MMKKSPLALLLCGALTAPIQAEDLLDIYQIAKQNDPQLRAAKADRDAAQLGEPLARSLLLPSISLSGGATLIQQNNQSNNNSYYAPGQSGGDVTYNQSNLGVNLSQTLYRRDRSLQLEQASDRSTQAETLYSAEEQLLMVRVADAYFGILSAQENLEFVQAQNAAIARQLDQAKQRFDVGLIAITAVHEAQAASDQARADLILARNDLDTAREALREIIDSEVTDVSPMGKKVPLELPAPANAEEWAAIAVKNNPGVITARQEVEIARKEIEVQRSARLPTLDLVGSYSVSRTAGDMDQDQRDARVGVQLNLPLWLGGRIGTATRQATLLFDRAKEQLDLQIRAVNRQTRDAYRAVAAGISAVRALHAGIVSAKSALEATQAGFEVGTRTMVDVLNAERDLFSVKSNHATARYQVILASLQLKQAAGTLSEPDLEQINDWLK